MRCLHTTTYEIKYSDQPWFKTQGYATLSHRWASTEVLFHEITQHAEELRQATVNRRHAVAGLDKILGACITAQELSIEWMWIDSCCINKTDSTELVESINSMYAWYKDARVCITYLGDVTRDLKDPADPSSPAIFYDERTGKRSVWFTRGWTLQELLAPSAMRFYDADWNYFGTKLELAVPISQITGISVSYLNGTTHFREACIATKMSWMAGRETTREEDMAYSMAGVFNVNMNVQYGEGHKAFMRLQHALISKNDESLFAWKMPPGVTDEYEYRSPIPTVELGPYEWGLLAASPAWFAGCGAMSTHSSRGVVRHRGGFTLTPQGISGPIGRRDHYTAAVLSGLTVVGLIPYHMWLKAREKTTLRYSLNCWDETAPGTAKAVQVLLRPVSRNPAVFVRTDCQTYELVHSVKNTTYSMVGTVMQPELY
ncbi:heterokaryon incompatibility protein-domain-containing protein [Plectosphaerella plurivora]|uniref:Heterokaryon incompatibility protein-domain-containing protein n=1 Tax=Plectosphaerella plurivora TaxID=936078 RepID=A0A9P9AGL3_9PEZI|nr:heterokaryon incompatibility protein-domain-containing protein [Plectosphaerella plurivora]